MGAALEVRCGAVAGTVGRSSVEILIRRPALVISPQSPRAVEMILDAMTSWFARAPTGGSGCAWLVRASRPAEESSTAGIVRDLQRSSRGGGRDTAGGEQDRPARCAVLTCGLRELIADEFAAARGCPGSR